ncbi:PLP-dependent aminotransferase family protein [Streptomyces rectiverticillatus]|uniref:aminotransferase-like domain-containing protein n=1 Tax=Streptomyces rectiverticillatus TaxID=173860 RepID=UPI0015C3C494|nr:PLP-dependent aminotransferase family protein [Streptomyces rectiverticillatus]
MAAAPPGSPLDRADLHGSLADPALLSMNFLNEVAGRFPEAVSFAAGAPNEDFYDIEDVHRYLRAFCDYLADVEGCDGTRIRRAVFQYGRTKGIISRLITRHLSLDEGITADPESVVVTIGAQEALLLVLRALRATERDVVLAVAPTYVGLTGAAQLLDMPVHFVGEGPDGVDIDDFVARVGEVRAAGLRPRALYLVPTFSNPTGVTMTSENRQELLDAATREGVLLLEDNPYGLFRATGVRLPTLKALDRRQQVVYLGSLSKSCFPGARVGYVVADQAVTGGGAGRGLFADELSKLKSMVTVNTSAVSQAVVGGMLLEHGCSLTQANKRQVRTYRRNLNCLVAGLEKRLGGVPGVSWNIPDGGFFVVLTVPFTADDALLQHSAVRHGVLWMPMSHFHTGEAARHRMRLSFSWLTPARIDEGLDRLDALIRERIAAT